jgi:hypothetical protein
MMCSLQRLPAWGTRPQWRFHKLQTGYDCMVIKPEAVARMVMEAV